MAVVATLGLIVGTAAKTETDNRHRLAAIAAGSSDFEVSMSGSVWRGEMTYKGRTSRFTLSFHQFADGRLYGEMDWGGGFLLEVRGSYDGNRLRFVDTKFLKRRARTGLGDQKDVVVDGSKMVGTDKGGVAKLEARRVR